MATLSERTHILSTIAAGLGAEDTPTGRLGRQLQRGSAAQIRAEEEERRREEQKAGTLGQIGSTLGGLGGILAAPLTGGASLGATVGMGALGGAVGGAAGRAVGGGDVSGEHLLGYGLQGGMSGALTHFAPQMGEWMGFGGAQQAAPQVGAPGITSPQQSPFMPTGAERITAAAQQGAQQASPFAPAAAAPGVTQGIHPGRMQHAYNATMGRTPQAAAQPPSSMLGETFGPQMQNWMQGQMMGQMMGLTPQMADPGVRTRVQMQYDPYNDTWRAGHAYPI